MLARKIIVKTSYVEGDEFFLLLVLLCRMHELFVAHFNGKLKSLASPHAHSNLYFPSALCSLMIWII